ncbi:MAG: NAD(P)H-hydrate dehydratase [Euryarchaeota archaeon]|nr:NAD(P)H-hydrate dehydratase [Euryarchaeota archaeon]
MRILDINSEYFGVPRSTLMENAGKQVFEALRKRFKLRNKKIAVFCGTGNNGGDGFVAARHLTGEGAKVDVILLGSEAREKFELIKKNKKIKVLKETKDNYDIIIDAILGTGIEGELREPAASAVERINKSEAFKVSVDVPTGIGSTHCVNADLVVTFHAMKKGLEKFDIVVADIGIPKEAESCVGPGDLAVNLKRDKESRKGDNGKVLVVGGGDLYYGAPVLSAFGVLNSGADLVYLAVPEANYEVTRTFSPDFIVRKYPGGFLSSRGVDTILEIAKNCDCAVIGPGLGLRSETKSAVLEVLKKIKIPVVIDADALKAIAEGRELLKKLNAVLTPHAGEFKILTGEDLSNDFEERKKVILRQAKKLNAAILLKAPVDIIASQDGRMKLNATGNAGMTVGGTGDVLAGIVASFMAQRLEPFTAACCAAFVNGAAGDELYKSRGYCFTASDIAGELPNTIKKFTASLY